MTQPDLTVADALVNLLDSNWGSYAASTNPTKPDVIDTKQAAGKGTDLANNDYVLLSRTTPISISYSDLPMSSQDIDAACFVEVKTADSDARRNEIFDEIRLIIEKNRKRPDTPNDFDRMEFGDITPLEDETFGVYLIEFVVVFEARSRSV